MSTIQEGPKAVTQEEIFNLYNLYSQGYGMWPSGTVVHDAFRGIDHRKVFARVIRAKGVLDSTTAIIHATTDQQVLDYIRKRTPLQELIPTETNRGKVAKWDLLTSRNAGGPVVETVSSVTAQTDTYTSPSVNCILWLEAGGWTDFNLLALASQYPPRDARALSIRNKLNLMAEEWECELLNGNLSSAFSNADARYDGANFSAGFCGLKIMALNSSELWAGLLINSKGGNEVTATDINNMLTNAADNNIFYNLAVTDGTTHDYLRSLAMSHVRYTDPVGEIVYGIQGIRWNHPQTVCNIIQSDYMPNLAGYRQIVFMDTTKLAQRLLLDSTVELLAKVAPQQTFMVKKFGTLIDKYDPGSNSSGNAGANSSRKSHVGFIMYLA